MRLSRDTDTQCHCGNHGCLESVASVPAIVSRPQAEGVDANSGSEVIDLLKAGDIAVVQAVRQAGRDLGEILASTVSLINPSVVVIGGSLASIGEHLITGVREVVLARAMPLATKGLTIVQSTPQGDAAIVGAGVLAVDHALHAVKEPSTYNSTRRSAGSAALALCECRTPTVNAPSSRARDRKVSLSSRTTAGGLQVKRNSFSLSSSGLLRPDSNICGQLPLFQQGGNQIRVTIGDHCLGKRDRSERRHQVAASHEGSRLSPASAATTSARSARSASISAFLAGKPAAISLSQIHLSVWPTRGAK